MSALILPFFKGRFPKHRAHGHPSDGHFCELTVLGRRASSQPSLLL